jgi:hypothetical protein
MKAGLLGGLGAAGLSVASTALAPGIAQASVNVNTYMTPDYLEGLGGFLFPLQTQWAYCGLCRNLYYIPESANSICAYYYLGVHPLPQDNPNGNHVAGSPTNYGTVIGNPADIQPAPPTGRSQTYYAYFQSPWRWCERCSCLFWGGGQSESVCSYSVPNEYGSNHVSTGSGTYYMPNGLTPSGGYVWTSNTSFVLQPGWRYCRNCKDLYWGGAWSKSWCIYQILNPNADNGNNGWGHAPGDTVYYLNQVS